MKCQPCAGKSTHFWLGTCFAVNNRNIRKLKIAQLWQNSNPRSLGYMPSALIAELQEYGIFQLIVLDTVSGDINIFQKVNGSWNANHARATVPINQSIMQEIYLPNRLTSRNSPRVSCTQYIIHQLMCNVGHSIWSQSSMLHYIDTTLKHLI